MKIFNFHVGVSVFRCFGVWEGDGVARVGEGCYFYLDLGCNHV